jgi:acetyl/propionyl-CoA carboxylase alpha subunit
MHHAFRLRNGEHTVELSRSRDAYRLHWREEVLEVKLAKAADGRCWLAVGDRRVEVVVAARGDDVFVHVDGEAYHLHYRHPLDRLAVQTQDSTEDNIRAEMPGTLVEAHIATGDVVTQGQALLVMESMKMETTIVASRDGVIAAVYVDKGETFARDALLVSMEPARQDDCLT